MAGGSKVLRALLLAFVVSAALVGTTAAAGAPAADGVLNQTQASDVAGDSGTGPDLSSLAVTSYTDGTISFAVGFANRAYLESGETVQIFIDLNDDGKADLNLSVWPSFDPSYLDRASGSGWVDIRQLPELAQASGSVSVRLSLSELQSDAAVPVAPTIQVAAGTWSGGSAGTAGATANDWLPSSTTWIDHSINPSTAGTTTTATSTNATTTTTSKSPSAPQLMGDGFGFKLQGSGRAREAELSLRVCDPSPPLRLVVREHLKAGAELGREVSFTTALTGGKSSGAFDGMPCSSYSKAWKLASALYGKGWIISTFQVVDAQGHRSGTPNWPLRAPAA